MRYETQRVVYQTLSGAAEDVSRILERTQKGFEMKHEELTEKYDALTSLVTKSGIVSTAVDAVEDTWDAVTSWF